MVLARPLSSSRRARPSAGRGRWRDLRLTAFEWIQLLLVLWYVASEVLSFQAGLSIAPQAPQRGSEPGVPIGSVPIGWLLLRVTDAALVPLLAFGVSRRFPLWHRWKRHVVYYLGALAGLYALAYLRSTLQLRFGLDPFHGWMYYGHRTFEFAAFSVFAHGMLYGERFHEKEREELRLRAEVAESTADRMRAQVRALRMEWSPGFLTETLGSVAELLLHDASRAKRMLLGLSAVLRRVLAHVRMETVRLEKEVELVGEALGVEALRRPGSTVEWEIDERALELPVPHMALLRIVFQALRDCPAAAPVRVRIFAAPDGSAVRLRVDASGVLREERVGIENPESAREPVRHPDGAGHDFRPLPPPARSLPSIGRGFEIGTYAIFVLFYTAVALHTAHARVADASVALAAPTWLYVVGNGFYAALWWSSFVWVARFLSTRHPIRQKNWPRGLAIHLLGAVLVSVLNAVAYYPFQRYVVEGGSVVIGFLRYWEWGDLTVYPPLAGIAHGFVYAREYHAKRISELRLRSLLLESERSRTEAELQALKAELNPHFLFNALNTVSSLMHTRVDEARRVTAHLAALLRRVLESGGLQEVSVEEEIEFLRLYLEIEQARFGDALRIEYRLDPAVLRARVPHLLLQPLVENAVKHGFRPRGGVGRITVSAERVGGWLQLAVVDDGVGLRHASAAEGSGTGLANVRQRLRRLYGSEHHFELASTETGGAGARIRIPFSEQPAPHRHRGLAVASHGA